MRVCAEIPANSTMWIAGSAPRSRIVNDRHRNITAIGEPFDPVPTCRQQPRVRPSAAALP